MKSVNNLEDYFFGETNEIPNNPLLPLIIYRAVIKNFENLATQFEKIFYVNHWKPTWRFGIYDFPHYPSNAHEVIGVYRGRAKVLLGHRRGLSTWLKPGDVVVIPAGVGHQSLQSTPDFCAVGGYPIGQRADTMRADALEKSVAQARIDRVPLPRADPIYGVDGPLMALW